VFIMLAGILLTLDRLHIVDAAFTVRLWPVVFIAAGVWLLVSRKGEPKARFWGSFWTFLGSWWLLNSVGLVRVGFWELAWPIALTWLGFNLIRQTLGRGTLPGEGERDALTKWFQSRFTNKPGGSGTVTLFAVMGETKRAVTDEAFRGGEMTSFMGGCRLDLRQAVMAPGEEATINVFAMMGGHEIWVPSTWNVVSNILPVMGGVDDKRLPAIKDPAASTTEARPKLLLRGVVFMGGLVIKS
jgi:hypothetical protein